MEPLLAAAIAVLIGVAAYLLTDRHLIRVLLGVVLLSNAVNLALFLAGDLTRGAPPIVPAGSEVLAAPAANALPQALVLTAIVIGFGLFAFTLALIYQTWKRLGAVDSDCLDVAEKDEPDPQADDEERCFGRAPAEPRRDVGDIAA